MADITDGALVDAILNADIESFEFDNCALDSIEELLYGLNEADLSEAVSTLPSHSASCSDATADYQAVTAAQLYASHGTTATSSSMAPSSFGPSRALRYSLSQSEHHHLGRQAADAHNSSINFQSFPGSVRTDVAICQPLMDHPQVHRRQTLAGMDVELQTYTRNPRDCIVTEASLSGADYYRLEQSGSLRGRPDHLGSTQPRLQHIPNHVPPHHSLQSTVLPPSDVHSNKRMLPGNASQSAATVHTRQHLPNNRAMNLGEFHPGGGDSVVDVVPMVINGCCPSGDVLDSLLSDREAMDRILEQISITNGCQLQPPVSTDSNQLFPVASTSTVMSSANQGCSSYPDTPPESGSEAHSPPENIQPMISEPSSTHDVRSVSAGKVSVASGPEIRSTLPPYHSSHLTSAAGSAPPPHPASFNPLSAGGFDRATVTPLDAQLLMSDYNRGSLSHKAKKRKHSISPQNTVNSSIVNALTISAISANLPVKPVNVPANLPLKPEPVMVSDGSEDDTCGYDNSAENGNASYQVIKWTNHLPGDWFSLVDESGRDASITTYRVDADKGFNFSGHDESFVCQKKNHFQVTVHIAFPCAAKFIRSPQEGPLKIDDFFLNFHGIKMESPNQQIKIEQSQSDRSKRPLHPVRVDFGSPSQLTAKAVIGRLHFSETTTNNMRKRGKPNPDQRYFQLVVSLFARSGSRDFVVAAQVSERIIVRASNPGQFDGDVDSPWTKGKNPDSIVHMGNVGINVENPDEALTVHGNIKLTGHVVAPSDMRAKTDVRESDTSQQLKNISQINVYHYRYNEEFAKFANIAPDARSDTGVLAQEVRGVLPDAVQEVGDVVLPDGERIENFLVVNKDRVFMESIGAVKELCKVTDKLEDRINEIEVLSKQLKKHGGCTRDSVKSTLSTRSGVSTCSSVSRSDVSPTSPGKLPSSNGLSTQQSSHHQRHHHHHHRRHHRSSDELSNKEEKGPCSNRVVQVIIIILVFIMALCMVAIATWFILKDNRDNGLANEYVLPTPPMEGNMTGNGTTDAYYDQNWTSVVQTSGQDVTSSGRKSNGAPLIWPQCVMTSCSIMHCCTLGPIETTVPYSEPTSSRPTTLQSASSSMGTPTFNLVTHPGPTDTRSPEPVGPTSPTRRATSTNPSTTGYLRIVPFGVPASKLLATQSTMPVVQGQGPTKAQPTTTQDRKGVTSPAQPFLPYNATGSGRSGPLGPGSPTGPSGPGGPGSGPSITPGPGGVPSFSVQGGPGTSMTPSGRGGPYGPSSTGDRGGLPGPIVYGPGSGHGPSKFLPRTSRRPDINEEENGDPGELLASQPRYTPKTSPSTQRPSTVSKTESVPSLSRVISNSSVRKSSSSSPMSKTTQQPVDLSVRRTPDPYPRYNIANQTDNPFIQILLDNDDPSDDDPSNSRKRRVADTLSLPLAVVLVKMGNESRSLMTNYCVNDECHAQEGGRFIYEVALSPSFPRLPVRIQFIVGSVVENAEVVLLCRQRFVRDCLSADSDELVTKMDVNNGQDQDSLNEWELPVGLFQESNFIFRIPVMPEVFNASCESSDVDAGNTYMEYDITFVRQCTY